MTETKTEEPKTAEELTTEEVLNILDVNINFLKDKIISLEPRKTKSILLNTQESSKIINTLLEIQQLHGLVISFHPEDTYSTEREKIKGSEETIYNKLIEISEQNVTTIDKALRIFQYYSTRTKQTPYVITSKICFSWLTTSVKDIPSFQSLVMQIISNCNKLSLYLRMLMISAKDKGKISMKKMEGVEEVFKTEYTLPPDESE